MPTKYILSRSEFCLLCRAVRIFLYAVVFNPLDSKGNYSATSNNMKLVHWPLMGGLLHWVQRGWAWAGCAPAQSVLAVPNATAHPSTASVPITVLLYDGPLLCGFNVAIKGLMCHLGAVYRRCTCRTRTMCGASRARRQVLSVQRLTVKARQTLKTNPTQRACSISPTR